MSPKSRASSPDQREVEEAKICCGCILRSHSKLASSPLRLKLKVTAGVSRGQTVPRTMRKLASQLATYYSRRNPVPNAHSRNFSSRTGTDEISLEKEAERKIGWVLKLFFAGTATFVGYQIFPYLGDNLMEQSVSLLQVKDPLFKRMGASRLARFAIDDKRRMKIVEIGGGRELLKMLEGAKDDRTRKEALKALSAISWSGEAAEALHHAGATSIIRSSPDSLVDDEIEKYKTSLLRRLQDLNNDVSS